jgi:hypothetical protein
MEEPDIVGTMPDLAGAHLDGLYVEEYWHGGSISEPAGVIHICADGKWHVLYFDYDIVYWRDGTGVPEPYSMPELDAEVKIVDLRKKLSIGDVIIFACSASSIEAGSEVKLTFSKDKEILFRCAYDSTSYFG